MPETNETVSVSERIRSDLERQILSGALKPDDRIPIERELMEIYACSRMTVNKAVSDLASRGLIVRRKRAGSFVAHPPSDSTILDIPDIRLDLERKGYAYAYRLLHRAVRAAKGAEEIALAGKGGRVIELRGVHKADGQPFGYEYRLVNLAAVPELESADFAAMPPGTWLLGHVPWSQAEHRIFAVAADAGIAGHLGIAERTPCLMLERRTWLDGMPVTRVWQTFPGDRHSFIGALTRRQA